MNKMGAIDQLNMGEGKTRVILPMLALYWGDKGDCVVSIVGEMIEYIHVS